MKIVIVALAIMMTSLASAHPHPSQDDWDTEFGIKGSSNADEGQVHVQHDQGPFQQGDTVIQIQRGKDGVQTQTGVHVIQTQTSNDSDHVQHGGHVIQIQQGDGKKCQEGSVLIVRQSHNGKENVQIQQGVNLQQGSSGEDDQPCEFQQGNTNGVKCNTANMTIILILAFASMIFSLPIHTNLCSSRPKHS